MRGRKRAQEGARGRKRAQKAAMVAVVLVCIYLGGAGPGRELGAVLGQESWNHLFQVLKVTCHFQLFQL